MPTTPNHGIWTPSSSDIYAITEDLAATAQTIEEALNDVSSQVRYFSGTSSSRLNFSSEARPGDTWQDTDGKQFKYTWLGGEWKPNRITQVMPFLEPFSAYNPETQGAGVVFEFFEGVVSFSGAASVADSTNISLSNPICNLPEWGRPTLTQTMGIQQGSGDSIWSLSVRTDFTLAGVRYRPYSSSSRIWLPFSGTYTLSDF